MLTIKWHHFEVGETVQVKHTSRRGVISHKDVLNSESRYFVMHGDQSWGSWYKANELIHPFDRGDVGKELDAVHELLVPKISLDTSSRKKCSCPTFELIHFGCKCGGI